MRVTHAFIAYAATVAGDLGRTPQLPDNAGRWRRAWHRLMWGRTDDTRPGPSSIPLALGQETVAALVEPHDSEPAGWGNDRADELEPTACAGECGHSPDVHAATGCTVGGCGCTVPREGPPVGRLVELDQADELAFAAQRDSDRERAGIPDEIETTGRHFASSGPAPAPAEPTAWRDAVAAFLAEEGEHDVLADELERVGNLLADLGQTARIILRMVAHDRRHREVRSPA